MYTHHMSKNKRKRPQAPKVGNKAMNAAFQEIRRSSAASPHTPKTAYKRKPKHGKDWQ